MRDRTAELGEAAVAVVTFTKPRNVAGYRRLLGIDFPVLADPERSSYKAFGLGRGRWWDVWGWQSVKRYAQLVRRGKRFGRPTEDTMQLGGDVVIDASGRVAFIHRGKGPADRTTIDRLVTEVQNARR